MADTAIGRVRLSVWHDLRFREFDRELGSEVPASCACPAHWDVLERIRCELPALPHAGPLRVPHPVE